MLVTVPNPKLCSSAGDTPTSIGARLGAQDDQISFLLLLPPNAVFLFDPKPPFKITLAAIKCARTAKTERKRAAGEDSRVRDFRGVVKCIRSSHLVGEEAKTRRFIEDVRIAVKVVGFLFSTFVLVTVPLLRANIVRFRHRRSKSKAARDDFCTLF